METADLDKGGQKITRSTFDCDSASGVARIYVLCRSAAFTGTARESTCAH
jgi:hypothetical protein